MARRPVSLLSEARRTIEWQDDDDDSRRVVCAAAREAVPVVRGLLGRGEAPGLEGAGARRGADGGVGGVEGEDVASAVLRRRMMRALSEASSWRHTLMARHVNSGGAQEVR
jgi:hypothetical protein